MAFEIEKALAELNQEIEHLPFKAEPQRLYDPIRYILANSGKRVRPLLALIGYYLFDDTYAKAMQPAIGVEMFHNFTLLHDDIMDQAPLRRGIPTVHEKWDENTAILSGDVMLVKVYDRFLGVDPEILPVILQKFNRCAAEVCEGQQYDMNFETSDRVQEADYLEMIRLKTAVLLGFSLEMGALLGGASAGEATLLKEFGENIGVGFQLKDDLLDVYGDQRKFGKQVGGDIIANKKTYLLIKALELAEGEQSEKLNAWMEKKEFDGAEKVREVTGIYNDLNIKHLAETQSNSYFQKGFEALERLPVAVERKKVLFDFAQNLINREK
ncbi:polyprenyl synthetase family protein [Rapidithrix thailandica]|uniref:Polyprenyl synthetase family protein n=1 Tax=Rapidithrix thailandica TaxID=413964 RepID=A0AAW9SAW1_9BACT